MSAPRAGRGAHRLGALLAIGVASAAFGCSGVVSLYEPKHVAQHELTLRYDDGFQIYEGKRLLADSPGYEGLSEFVRCVPRAAEHAEMAEDDGSSAVGTGIAGGVLGVAGLGGLVGLAYLDRNDTTAFAIMGTGLAVGLLGVSLAIVSRSMKNSANGHAVDALNFYNDQVGSRGYSCAKPPPSAAEPPPPLPAAGPRRAVAQPARPPASRPTPPPEPPPTIAPAPADSAPPAPSSPMLAPAEPVRPNAVPPATTVAAPPTAQPPAPSPTP